MKFPRSRRQIATLVALVLLAAGCDTVESVAGQAAKEFLDRAAAGLGSEAGPDGETSGAAPDAVAEKRGGRSGGEGGNANVYYQYVDDSGSVRFVQDRSQIPAEHRQSAGRIELETRPAGAARTAASPRSDIWKRAAEAPWSGGNDDEIVMYTAPWCGVCRKADAYFRSEGVRYTAKDIEASDAYKRELMQKTGRSAVPVIEIGDERMVGWDQRRVAKLLLD